MQWSRRDFLGLMAAASVPLAGAPAAFAEDNPGYSILQGMTDETSAQFSIVLPKLNTLRLEILDSMNNSQGFEQNMVSREFSEHAVAKVCVDGLRLGETYRLRLLNGQNQVEDERTFTTLDLSERAIRIGYLSCMLDLLHSKRIWRQLEAQNPELIFFLGDNVYADRTSFFSKNAAGPEQLWERYVTTRKRVQFYYFRRLIPVLAIWDDHDFGADNMGRSFPYKEESRQTFEAFFAQADRPALQAGPGIARKFSAFGADFYLLDGRTYRDNPSKTDGRILGASQEKWLFPKIDSSRVSWMLNGSMFYGQYQGGESFEGAFAQNFSHFREQLKQREALACFASGDVHYSEIMDIEQKSLGYPTFELVASSMHSYTFPGHHKRNFNPRRRQATSSHNFLIYEGRFDQGRVEGEVVSWSSDFDEFRGKVGLRR